jgi:hypothetical protein
VPRHLQQSSRAMRHSDHAALHALRFCLFRRLEGVEMGVLGGGGDERGMEEKDIEMRLDMICF